MNQFALRHAKTLFSVGLIAALSSVGVSAAAAPARAPAAKPVNPAVCQVVVIEYDSTDADERGSDHSSPAVWVLMCPEAPVRTDAS